MDWCERCRCPLTRRPPCRRRRIERRSAVPPPIRFIYRFFEVVMLYGPGLKDVPTIVRRRIMSAIDMSWTSRRSKTARRAADGPHIER